MLIEIVKFILCLAGTIVITAYIVGKLQARFQNEQEKTEEQREDDLFYCGCRDSLLAYADDLFKERKR